MLMAGWGFFKVLVLLVAVGILVFLGTIFLGDSAMLVVLVSIGVLLVGVVFLQVNQISGAITTLSHQLEYLGAPLELGGYAKRRARTRWIVTSTTFRDGRVEHYIAPDEESPYAPPYDPPEMRGGHHEPPK